MKLEKEIFRLISSEDIEIAQLACNIAKQKRLSRKTILKRVHKNFILKENNILESKYINTNYPTFGGTIMGSTFTGTTNTSSASPGLWTQLKSGSYINTYSLTSTAGTYIWDYFESSTQKVKKNLKIAQRIKKYERLLKYSFVIK